MKPRLLLVSIISILFFAPVSVIAQSVSTDGTGQSSIDARLTQAVQDQHLVLDDATRAVIVQKCQGAQAILNNVQDNTDKVVRLRLSTYGTFQKEFQAIKLRMGRQGVDASEIDLLIGKLQQAMDNFTLTADKYGQTLDDIQTVDCAQKPEEFAAGLVVMRIERTQLLDSATKLKSILLNSDGTTFNQLKKRLTV